MTPNTQPLADMANQQLETAMRIAKIALDGAERMMKFQLEAAKQAVEDAAKSSAQLAEAKDLPSALALRTKLSEHSLESVMGLSRTVYELATQTQAEFTKLAEEQAGALNKTFMANIEKVSKSAPAGSDVLMSSMKSSMAATAAAVESLTKASKQVAEFADTSLKAATTATADAVKNATKAGKQG